jgi:hypothetical protein
MRIAFLFEWALEPIRLPFLLKCPAGREPHLVLQQNLKAGLLEMVIARKGMGNAAFVH